VAFAEHPITGAQPLRTLVDGLAGRTIVGIRRIFYVYAGEVNDGYGAVVVFEVGPAAQELGASEAPFDDPFAPPLSRENAEFVRTHGKWTAFDVAAVEPYARLVGGRVAEARTIEQGAIDGRPGFVQGAVIATERLLLRVEILADEEYVSCWPPDAFGAAAEPSGSWTDEGYVENGPRYKGPIADQPRGDGA
jgi:hypothetical protein